MHLPTPVFRMLTDADHAPFPVLARASWGFWGSYIAIISRAILAVFWFAIQTMNGANTVRVMYVTSSYQLSPINVTFLQDRRDMALLPNSAEPHPRLSGDRNQHDDLVLHLLAAADTLPLHAPK